MTPTERRRWAINAERTARAALADAKAALQEAEMERHYADFIYTAASEECPTCNAPAGAYCAIFRRQDGTYTSKRDGAAWPVEKLVALFLHPARTTTPAALAAALS